MKDYISMYPRLYNATGFFHQAALASGQYFEHSYTDVSKYWTAFNIAAELIIFVIPNPVVSFLQMGRAKKIGVLPLSSIGLIVIGVASVRAPTLAKLSDHRDMTRTIAPTFIWSCAELAASNVVITMPAVRKFLHAALWQGPRTGTLPHRLDTMASFDSLGRITVMTAVNSVNTGADEKWR
ncbi:putative integral membrane protein [Diaporthe ampelina]|uniref:Putative integral membrane protein n=1 Tax=Diaporthe ampelina TaxID=1214573 RepID=A0A0G2FHW3_9PEZI|nr:putative integral membrane protein [Diaporthe ampelina]